MNAQRYYWRYSRRVWIVLLALAGLVFISGAAAMDKKHHAGKGKHVKTNCNIQSGPCTLHMAGDYSVRLEVLPRPVKAMENLTFAVSFSKPLTDGAVPHIDLNMPAMDMGKNQVALTMTEDGGYTGSGVIVR